MLSLLMRLKTNIQHKLIMQHVCTLGLVLTVYDVSQQRSIMQLCVWTCIFPFGREVVGFSTLFHTLFLSFWTLFGQLARSAVCAL